MTEAVNLPDQPWTSITYVGIEDIPTPEHFTRFVDEQINNRSVHEQDFFYLQRFAAESLVVIDAGSNIGNSAISSEICAPNCQILGFEPNASLTPFLERARRFCGNFTYHLFGLAEHEGVRKLYIPVVAGRHISGESSMDLDNFHNPVVIQRLRSYSAAKTFSLECCEFPFKRLDDVGEVFSACQAAGSVVFKIDVEGAELSVMKGAAGFLTRFHPLILIENGGRPEIASFAASLGYRRYLRTHDNRLVDANNQQALNSFYGVPAELTRHALIS